MRVCFIPPQGQDEDTKDKGLVFVEMTGLPELHHFITLPRNKNTYRAHKIVHAFRDLDGKHEVDIYLQRVRRP